MIEVTELAQTKLREYMEQNKVSSPLRVALMSMGCSGSALGLALDEEKNTDEKAAFEGLTVLVEKALLDQCGDVTVDYIEAGARSGFSISSTNPVGGGGCSSGSCGSCGC